MPFDPAALRLAVQVFRDPQHGVPITKPITAMLAAAKGWTLPKCLRMGAWLNKVFLLYNGM